MNEFGNIISSMIGTIAVIDLLAILIQGTKKFFKESDNKINKRNVIILGIIGGLFGVYANITGFVMKSGTIVTIRDVGPMMAGCFGGPLAGLIAGIIAGLHRLYQGMPNIIEGTTIPCAISTVLIGLICGKLFDIFRKKDKKGILAFIVAVIMEAVHLFLAFIYIWIVTDFNSSFELILEITPAFLLSNGIAFGLMIYSSDRINEYKTAESAKEKIEVELNTATNIQKAMIPSVQNDLPDRSEFDIYADMVPAKQVGGDFYDFYFIDDDHFAFLIADVSDKGVPAALFMAITKTILKSNLQLGLPLEEAIEKSNRQLVEENNESMFVTAWIAVLEISTGKVQYVNAGHNPPILRKADNSIIKLKERSGLILAADSESKYKVFELKLEKNDTLFVYTDGVTEANNKTNEMYGGDRLLKVLTSQGKNNAKQICENVKKDIDNFVEDANQFDDITMMVLKYN